MLRFLNFLLNLLIAKAVWEVAVYLGNDPIKVTMIYICVCLADIAYRLDK